MNALARTRGQRNRMTAEQYREKAASATALALAATLDRVRERHEQAATAWSNLAGLYETRLAEQAAGPPGLAAPSPVPLDALALKAG